MFNNFRWLFGHIALAWCLTSCSLLSNKNNSIALQCGFDLLEVPTGQILLKLVNSDGSDLNSVQTSTIQAREISPLKENRSLHLTKQSCVMVDKKSEVFQAIAKDSEGFHQVTVDIRNVNGDQQITKIPLKAVVKKPIAMKCSSPGYYSSDFIVNPLVVDAEADLRAIDVSLVARSKDRKINRILFRKPYGQSSLSESSNVDVASLPEGEFELLFEGLQNGQVFDEKLEVPQADSNCGLWVIQSKPNVSSSLNLTESKKSVFQKGQAILWSAVGITSQLRVCKRRIALDEDEVLSVSDGTICSREDYCSNESEFEDANLLIAQEEGVFDYHYYAKDKAGNRSESECRRVVISSEPPMLNISWRKNNWNHPHSVIEKPVKILELEIFASHPQLSDEELSAKLECRVDFLLDGVSLLAGKDAQCVGGKCDGASLEDFRPCAKDFSVSLAKYWEKYPGRASQLTVTARLPSVNDRPILSEARLWLHPSRWAADQHHLKGKGLSVGIGYPRFIENISKDMILLSEGGMFTKKNQESVWEPISAPPGISTFNLVQNSTNEVFLVGERDGALEATPSFLAFKLNKGEWILKLESDLLGNCLDKIEAYALNSLLCLGANSIVVFDGERVRDLNLPAKLGDEKCLPMSLDAISSTNGGEIWVACDGDLYRFREDTLWIKIDAISGQDLQFVDVDKSERIWARPYLSPENALGGYWFEDRWTEVAFPVVNSDEKSISENNLVSLSDGSLYFYDYQWSEFEEKWVSLLISGSGVDRVHFHGLPNGNRMLFRARDEYRMLENGIISYVLPPWKKGAKRINASFLDSAGTIYLLASSEVDGEDLTVFSIGDKQVALFGPEIGLGVTEVDYSRPNLNFFRNSETVISALLPEESLIEWRKSGDFKVRDLPEENTQATIIEKVSCNLHPAIYNKEGFVSDDFENHQFLSDDGTAVLKITDTVSIFLSKGTSDAFIQRNGKSIPTSLPFPTRMHEDPRFGFYCGVQINDDLIIWDRETPDQMLKFDERTLVWKIQSLADLGVPLQTTTVAGMKKRDGRIDEVLIEDNQGNYSVYDTVAKVTKKWTRPAGSFFDEIIEISPGRYAAYGAGGLFIGNGIHWTRVYHNLELIGGNLLIDDFGRIWIGGRYGSLLIQVAAS